MKDLITYCPNIANLCKELTDKAMVDENGEPVLALTKTPLSYSNPQGKTLSLVRITCPEELEIIESLDGLMILGTYKDVFADEALLAMYDSVYDRSTQVWTDPETGEKHTYTPPEKFGVFA